MPLSPASPSKREIISTCGRRFPRQARIPLAELVAIICDGSAMPPAIGYTPLPGGQTMVHHEYGGLVAGHLEHNTAASEAIGFPIYGPVALLPDEDLPYV